MVELGLARAALLLPEDLKGSFGVILIYRGAWCPYCNAQLAAFERLSAKLADVGVKVAAFSVDDEATTTALVEKHRIHYPVGFSADADAVAAATGAYVNAEPRYLQSTGFVLAPDGAIVTAVYSSGGHCQSKFYTACSRTRAGCPLARSLITSLAS